MKAFKILFFLTLATNFVACQQETKEEGLTIGDVFLSKAQPQQGDSITVTLNNKESVDNLVMNYSVGNKLYMMDAKLSMAGESVMARVRVPDSATSLAFDFMKDFETLNETVSIPVFDTNGTPLKGALIGQARYFKLRGNLMDREIETDSMIQLIRSDLDQYPELKNENEIFYAQLLMDEDKEAANVMLTEIENKLLSKSHPNENDLLELRTIYNLQKNSTKSDSINTLLAEKFTPDNPALYPKYSSIVQMKDKEAKQTKMNEFIASYPENLFADYLRSDLAGDQYRKGDKKSYLAMNEKIGRARIQASGLNNIAWDLAEKGEDLEFAAKISKKSMDVIKREIADPEINQENTTIYLSQTSLKRSLDMYRDTYALIIFQLGEVKAAIEEQEQVAGINSSPDVNERYIQYLIKDEQYDKALEKASEFITHNISTPEILKYLEIAFTENGNEGSYQDLIASLELEAKEQLRKEIAEMMINEEATGFTLKNIEGEEIALADLKGKTVILDFWATWCGPCKASFPGMQQALENYKDDENVVFLFINTWEGKDSDNRDEIAGNFVKENNYTFNVLIDNYDPESKGYEVVQNYEVSGIPTKFVIGPDGNIKFKSIGYSGNPNKLVDEMEIMIELAQS